MGLILFCAVCPTFLVRFILESEHLAYRVSELVDDSKGLDICVIDLRSLSSYTDFLVLTSGTSDRHVQAIGEKVSSILKKEDKIKAIGTEGLREGQWGLIDFGSVILHIFHQFTRNIYALEQLWESAPRLDIEQKSSTQAAP
jgi:ribosome-associated protein